MTFGSISLCAFMFCWTFLSYFLMNGKTVFPHASATARWSSSGSLKSGSASRTMHIWSSFSSGNLMPAYLLHDDHQVLAVSVLNLELPALLKITTKFSGLIALKHSSMIAAFDTSPVSGRSLANTTRTTSETEQFFAISCSYLLSHSVRVMFESFRPGVSMRPTFGPSFAQRSVEKYYVHPPGPSLHLNLCWLLEGSYDNIAFKQELLPTPKVPKTDTTCSAFHFALVDSTIFNLGLFERVGS